MRAVLILLRERKKEGKGKGKGESRANAYINPYPYFHPNIPQFNISKNPLSPSPAIIAARINRIKE